MLEMSTTEQISPDVIDAASKFDPRQHFINVQGGREYLPAAARLVWFRKEHPDYGIVTTPVEINFAPSPDMKRPPYAIFQAQIFDASGKLLATAHKYEDAKGFPDFLEKAETGSVSRALSYLGYGTANATDLDEGERFADAPQEPRNRPRQAPQGNNRPYFGNPPRGDRY